MKAVNIVISIVLFLIFFVWAFYGNYTNFLSFYVPYLPALFFLIFLTLSLKKVTGYIDPILDFFTKYSFWIFPVTAFIYALAVCLFVFSGMPHVQDEINMFFQAQAILEGNLSRPLHPFYEFFRFLYIIPSKNGTYSLYQPGFPSLLAPFLFLGIPYLLNPLLTGATVFLLGKNTEKIFDRKTAALSMFLATSSTFLIPMGGTYMNHTFCAFSSLASMWFIQKSFDKKPYLNTGIAAIFIVLLMFTRPQLALFILISSIIFIFAKQDKKTFLLQTITIGATILPFFVSIFFFERLFSGDIMIPKHLIYFNYSEPFNNSFGLGLHKGCRFNTIIPLPKEGLTIPHAYYLTYLRLVQLVFGLFFHPIMFVLLPVLFLIRKKTAELLSEYIFLQYFMVVFIAYIFYYFDGNVYGPRYYYEASFFLVPLFARSIILSSRKLSEINFIKPVKPKVLFSSLLLSGIIFHYVFAGPFLFYVHSGMFWGMDPGLSELVEKRQLKNSLIFISPDVFYSSGAAAMNLFNIDSNENIYAIDLGDTNSQLISYYKNRKVYKAIFNPNPYSKMPPKLNEIKYHPPVNKITLEMENKSYPVEGIPDYCNKFPAWPYIDSYSGFLLPEKMLGNTYFFCRFISKDQFYTFGQYFEKTGTYKVTIKAAYGPVCRRFLLTVGNQKKIINFYYHEFSDKDLTIGLYLKKGINFIKLQPLDIRKEGSYFILDKLEFELEEK